MTSLLRGKPREEALLETVLAEVRGRERDGIDLGHELFEAGRAPRFGHLSQQLRELGPTRIRHRARKLPPVF